jgi:hypothetical protein
MRFIFSFSCFALGLLIFIGCHKPNAGKYGAMWNEHRVARTIRSVPSDAVLRNPGDHTGEHWIQPVPLGSGISRWGGKAVEVSNGSPTVETDIFYGPKFNDPQIGPMESVLRIGFDYRREKAGQTPWVITVHDGKSFMSRELSLEEAKKILTSWGLSY